MPGLGLVYSWEAKEKRGDGIVESNDQSDRVNDGDPKAFGMGKNWELNHPENAQRFLLTF